MAHNIEEKSRTKDVILEESVGFDSLLLKDEISKALGEKGFRKPSPIQVKAIPLGRCGFDLIVKSKSGTGKTLVFSIIALEAVTINKFLQAIIIAPTREIAVQIEDVLNTIGSFIEGLRVESFIGGLPLEDDIQKAKGTHIAVGAPGRLKHLILDGHLSVNHVKLLILDEADKLMESNFQSDITEIYNTLPIKKQMIASSATYPSKLDRYLSYYMVNPTHVSAEIETPMLLGLKQFVSVVNSSSNVVQMTRAKNDLLIEILSKVSFTQCLVFSNFQSRAESISNYLNQKGWTTSFISAAQSQTKRLEAVKDLKDFKSRILLSTDLTSRGIDAANVDLVVNYDIPNNVVTYLHRMGRAGRYGSPGICINLALVGEELSQLQRIIGNIGSTQMTIPKLPDLKETTTLDLWNLDLTKLEQIQGLAISNCENIKDEVLELNHSNNKNKKSRNQKIKNKENVEGLVKHEDDVMNIIKNSKKEVNEVCEQFSNLDTESLLLSLANGDLTSDSKNEIEINSTDRDQEDDDDSGKKRKRCEELISPLNFQKRKNETVNPTFCKNKALLSTTKLLCNSQCKSSVDDDTISSISDYLNYIKCKDEASGCSSVQDNDNEESSLLEIISQKSEIIEEKMPECRSESSKDEIIQNIFKVGYRYAIGSDKNHWLTQIPPEEYKAFQEFCAAELHEGTDEEDYEEEIDDYNMEEGNLDYTLVNNQLPSTSRNYNPVLHHRNDAELSVEQNEHFTKCFDECSDHLWQNGLTFESVDDFDSWYFNEWQQQLQSVRSYVQQNIYVAEMSNYHQRRSRNS